MVLKEFLVNNGYTKIKLKLTKTNHFEMKAKINGVRGRFILDTGASNTLVDASNFTMFHLEPEPSDVKVTGAGASNMDSKVSKKNQIKIGQWTNKSTVIVLFNLTHVNEGLKSLNVEPVNGIIGTDILKKGKAIIDYEKKYLYLKLPIAIK
ncbi:MAG: retroviral-like aspartic protease family protein [Bacteroidia bacterium]|nr:retroviral-like aspartic protease family protein [Bacteroidia bacterium]NND26282.1 clan AA aspartic protease [Flavobacteriaceae bacterium]MBT8278531.1 retroviral-like aspartic protease family protein [Bacteroidia bacterium]NNK61232.1 clan AA aspartic protease [Flavobacteriaceae bacterium]NNL33313.1 clan AA aspartic protease [Flavobacteriaceae bacterium]